MVNTPQQQTLLRLDNAPLTINQTRAPAADLNAQACGTDGTGTPTATTGPHGPGPRRVGQLGE